MEDDNSLSTIVTRKINNTTYVYEQTSYRDKNGNPRSKEVKTVTKKFIIEEEK